MKHTTGRNLSWFFLFAVLSLLGFFAYAVQLRAADVTASPQSQVQIGTLPANIGSLLIATPTRTPTPIHLGNFVWDDFDSDGRQDAGEPGLSGVSVQLWNSAKTQMLSSTTTNGNGNYTLIAPLPGNYRIRVVLPGVGSSFSPKDQAGGDNNQDSDINPSGSNSGFTDVIVIASNVISMTNHDAGVIVYRTPTPTRTPTPINLGNFVWDDFDSDGRQDAGEPGLSGVSVQLWNSAKTQMLSSTTTNGNGNYTLIAPLPGNYRIRVVLPGVGSSFSPKDQAGGDNNQDSDINPSGSNSGFTDVIVIASNVISMTNHDAGVIVYRTPTPTRTPTPIHLGNFVWDDLDSDGRQDAGEPGLSGITVQLWNSAKTQMIASTTTNGSGNYTLIAPLPGNYRIRVLLSNPNHLFAPKDQAGGDNNQDSDINPSGSNSGFTDVIVIASNVISMTNHDAGIITPLVIPPIQIINPVLATNTPLVNVVPIIPTPTAPSSNLCAGFRLTSPLDGLPNGVTVFYWDPVSVPGVTYQIMVFDDARNPLTTFTVTDATTLSGDVSQGAIGGSFQLIVQVTAVLDGRIICRTDERIILRAAPDPGAPQPTATRGRRG